MPNPHDPNRESFTFPPQQQTNYVYNTGRRVAAERAGDNIRAVFVAEGEPKALY